MNLRLVAAMLTGASLVPACGDKFLIVTRGTRYQVAPVDRKSAAILIYSNPASEVPKALDTMPIEALLHSVGYRPTVVVSAAEFERALNQGGWDVILAGMSDAQELSRRGKTATVVPVVLSSDVASKKAVKYEFPVVLKAPAKSRTVIEAIDYVLVSRPKGQSKAAGSKT